MKRKQTKGKIEKANVHLTTDNDIKKELSKIKKAYNKLSTANAEFIKTYLSLEKKIFQLGNNELTTKTKTVKTTVPLKKNSISQEELDFIAKIAHRDLSCKTIGEDEE
jgi:vacuolar-type H+-ATPase subunit I/STV1